MHRVTRRSLLALPALAACKHKYRPDPMATIEEPEDLQSSISMGAGRDAEQLLHGFYPAEQNAWRWTQRRFAVSLRPPAGAREAGARLSMTFTIPEAAAAALEGLEIRATVSGVALPPYRAPGAGEHEFQAPVPAAALAGEGVTVNFELSRWLEPGALDSRELGIVVAAIRFVEP